GGIDGDSSAVIASNHVNRSYQMYEQESGLETRTYIRNFSFIPVWNIWASQELLGWRVARRFAGSDPPRVRPQRRNSPDPAGTSERRHQRRFRSRGGAPQGRTLPPKN